MEQYIYYSSNCNTEGTSEILPNAFLGIKIEVYSNGVKVSITRKYRKHYVRRKLEVIGTYLPRLNLNL
jgi:hypothetical protein